MQEPKPSLIVITTYTDYDLDDFTLRSRTALTIASDRVAAKYGYLCGLVLAQLQ